MNLSHNQPQLATLFQQWDRSALVLVATNLIPLVGVLLFGWSTGVVLGLYWAENVVVGAVTLLKMLACRGGDGPWFKRLGLAAFFVVHYGAFAVGHAIALMVLVGIVAAEVAGGDPNAPPPPPTAVSVLGLWIALGSIAVSHFYDYFTEFLPESAEREKSPEALMFSPYPRLIVLHVVIVLGAFASLAAGSVVVAVALLVVLKTGLDLALHYGRRIWNPAAATGVA